MRHRKTLPAAALVAALAASPAGAQMETPVLFPVTGTMCDLPDTVKGFNEFLLRYPTDRKISDALKAFGGGCEQKTWMTFEKGIVGNFGRSDGRVVDIVMYGTVEGPRFSWIARPLDQAQNI